MELRSIEVIYVILTNHFALGCSRHCHVAHERDETQACHHPAPPLPFLVTQRHVRTAHLKSREHGRLLSGGRLRTPQSDRAMTPIRNCKVKEISLAITYKKVTITITSYTFTQTAIVRLQV